jgi:carboxyl-terminal processing protease
MRKILLVGISTFALGAGAMAYADQVGSRPRADTYRMLELFGDVLATVERNYVVPVDDKKLIEAAIDGMVSSLDPHSGYLSGENFEDLMDQNRGAYGGLGMEVTSEDGLVKVVAPMDGTPAAAAGIQTGDIIAAVDGQSVMGAGVGATVKQLRGAVGTSVTLTIARENRDPFDVKLTRAVINVKSATAKVQGDYGVVRISTFNENTAAEAQDAIRKLKADKPNLKGLILDLRNNPGGLLPSSVDVSDLFLDGGEVVSQRGRDPKDIERYNAEPGEIAEGLPIVVLVNNGSASAAEIVAGALQDRGRAKVVGLTTFGKGSVQTVIPMRGGRDGALKLTTHRYFTPSGRSIQRTGIQPDFQVAQNEQEADVATESAFQLSEASLRNALDGDTQIRRNAMEDAELPPKEFDTKKGDYQLARAVDLLNAGGSVTAIARKKTPAAPAKVAAAAAPVVPDKD